MVVCGVGFDPVYYRGSEIKEGKSSAQSQPESQQTKQLCFGGATARTPAWHEEKESDSKPVRPELATNMKVNIKKKKKKVGFLLFFSF